MSKHILVAYASLSGSTGEVAEAIGDVLASGNTLVDISPARDITSLDHYDALILGSSIRAGRWLPEALQFVEDYYETMEKMPVAYFTTCLTMLKDNEASRRTVLAYLDPVRQMAPNVTPLGIGLFAGSLDPERAAIMQTRDNLQGDYRNWDAIRAWAKTLRENLESDFQMDQTGEASYNLREAMLCYTTMTGLDLSQADLFKANLSESDLSEANLSQANLDKSELTRAKLHKANLSHASLSMIEAQGADLRGADLSETSMLGAQLSRADLSRASLYQATLNGANLSQANLQDADLRGADLNWADLRGADLSGADLSNAKLGWALLTGASLGEANLSGAIFNIATAWPDDFSPQDHQAILVDLEPQ